MNIEGFIAEREIKDILHFTTNHGLLGILASKAVIPRKRLPQDKYLEHIYKPNCEDRRRDAEWHDYVNLSITSINTRLFGICADNWHRDLDGWWSILSFRPEIITHSGVYFTTTNNMYSGVARQTGYDGLKRLFAPQISGYPGHLIRRRDSLPLAQPTCFQAEILYPGELSISFLKRILVRV